MSVHHQPARRAVSVAALSGIVAGALALAAPATAVTSGSHPGASGICASVLNQLARRGTVEPRLLAAAARTNAELIAALRDQRAAMVPLKEALAAQISAAQERLATLDAHAGVLAVRIEALESELALLVADRVTLPQQVTSAEAALATLRATRDALQAQIAELQAQQAPTDQLIPLRRALGSLNLQVSQRESELGAARTQLSTLETRIATTTTSLQDLNNDLESNSETAAAQSTLLASLRAEEAAIHDRISAIDRQIGLGGCVV